MVKHYYSDIDNTLLISIAWHTFNVVTEYIKQHWLQSTCDVHHFQFLLSALGKGHYFDCVSNKN